jgi:hypothetical protein
MVVVDLDGIVVAQSNLIEIVDEEGYENVIKVWVNEEEFFYICNDDRDTYVLYEDLDVPDLTKWWKLDNGEFIEILNNI